MKIMLWQLNHDRNGEKLVATFYNWSAFNAFREGVCFHNTFAHSFLGLSQYTTDDFRRDYRWVITNR